MSAAWPAELPQFVEAGATESLPTERVESTIQNGPQQTRRRIFGKTREFDASLFCPTENLADFEHFYRDVLKDGVLAFTWVHPRTQIAGLFKFKGPPPAYNSRGAGAVVMISFKLGQIR